MQSAIRNIHHNTSSHSACWHISMPFLLPHLTSLIPWISFWLSSIVSSRWFLSYVLAIRRFPLTVPSYLQVRNNLPILWQTVSVSWLCTHFPIRYFFLSVPWFCLSFLSLTLDVPEICISLYNGKMPIQGILPCWYVPRLFSFGSLSEKVSPQ